MATITKITVQKKNKERYNIFLDKGKGEEYAFSVDEDVLIKFNLKKGLELDDFAMMEIHYHDEIRKSYNQAIHYLARRMRSELEVRNYLKEKEVEEPVIQEVIHKLAEYRFINDEEFAIAYVRTQKNTTDKGPDVIRRELFEKGISAELQEKALAEYSFDEQVQKATKLWEKAKGKNARDSARILQQKAEQLLLRKGYSHAVISIVKEEANAESEEEKEREALTYQGEKAHRKYAKLQGFEYEQKMKQTLYRKGFSIEQIEDFLAEKKGSS